MEIWVNSILEIAHYDGKSVCEDISCEVSIDDAKIFVSYKCDYGTTVNYLGKDLGNGHYELRSTTLNSKASLHRFKDGKILEGFWLSNGNKGFWRIHLRK